MRFIERLKQEDAARVQREQQLEAQQEAAKMARIQKEADERERRAKRRQLAERFREESGVGNAVAKLGEYLSTPTIPITRSSFSDGIHDSWTDYIGRGSSSANTYAGDLPIRQRDPDSTFDTATWDAKDLRRWKKGTGGSYEYFTEKYIAVETCPDGTIVFHASWSGSTTIETAKWRTGNKEQLFDKALEKAYNNPGDHQYTVWHEQQLTGFG